MQPALGHVRSRNRSTARRSTLGCRERSAISRGVSFVRHGGPLALAVLTVSALAGQGLAGTTWTGAGTDTNVNNPDNWGGALPAMDGTASVSFGSGGQAVNMNADAFFSVLTYNRTATTGFTTSGTGSLILRSRNDSTASNFVTSTSMAGTNTFASNFRINTNNADTNKLFVIRNNSPRTTRFTGSVDRTSDSTKNFQIRFDAVAGSSLRFEGPVGSLDNIQQNANAWAGELVFASNQSLGSTAITLASGGTAPTSTARLVLGEDITHVQSWGNAVFNNTMNLVIGGDISIASITGTGNAGVTGTASGRLTFTGSNASTFAANLNLAGPLTVIKSNAATLTLSGTKTYTGATTINAGTLVLSTGASIASPVTNAAGGSLSGQGTITSSLTFGAGTSTLLFDTASPTGGLTAASLNLNPSSTVIITPSGTTSSGTTYNVLKLSASTFGATVPPNFLGASRSILALSAGNTILTLTPTTPASLTWAGNQANPTAWDTIATRNFSNAGSPDVFYANDSVTFNDSAASFSVVAQGTLSPASLSFANSLHNYTFSSGTISNAGALTKSGSGTVAISSNYSGAGITITGGELGLLGATNSVTGNLSVSNGKYTANTGALGASASNRTLTLDSATLSYTGGTLASDNLSLAMTGNSVIEVATSGVTLRAGGSITGSGALVIQGSGDFTFSRNTPGNIQNLYAGTINVRNGAILELRNPNSLGATSAGTTIESNSSLGIYPFNQANGVTFDPEPITLQNNTNLFNRNWTTTPLNNTLSGPITTQGKLTLTSISDLSGGVTLTFTGGISGAGSLVFGGVPPVNALAAPGTYVLASGSFSYTGSTTVNANSTLLVQQPLRPITGSLVVTGTGASVQLAAAPTPIASAGYTRAGEFAAVSVAAAGKVSLPSVDRSQNKATVVVASSLALGAGTTLDLGNADLILRGSSANLASIQAAFTAGLLKASAAAPGDANYLANTTLAIFVNDAGDGINPYFTSYDGVTSLGATDVIIKYTYLADRNLDGAVDGRDFKLALEGYTTQQSGWLYGDVDNSGGVVSASDFSSFLAAYGQAATVNLGQGASGDTNATSIPEPASLAVMALVPGLLTRRRR